ncbi:MAG: peroxidase [Cyanobacteria bacterium P01_G01_bin.38]
MSAINNNSQQCEELINNCEPIDANDPAYEQILKDLQGGIIKNYGRNYSVYIFIQFDEDNENKINEVKRWIRDEVAGDITSTFIQLEDTQNFREAKISNSSYSGKLCQNFFLSYQGYRALGYKLTNPTTGGDKFNDIHFENGMKEEWKRNYCLDSPPDDYWYNPPEDWDIGGEHQIHALILLAHDDLKELENEANAIFDKIGNIGKILACEPGYVLREHNNQAIGPFGFADGISQPLFLKKDYDNYKDRHYTSQWEPKASLNLVLVKDPFGEKYSYGSYCVFQKLETNYDCFEKKVRELSVRLGSNYERAGALVFGRFKNGTPLAISDQPNQSGDRHSFNYADDPEGRKCPLHAHIRKVNPRHDDEAQIDDRKTKNRIFRAGITYFDDPKAQSTPGLSTSQLCFNKLDYLKEVNCRPLEENIANISGLLFVSFQSDIQLQFLTQQKNWADNRRFPREEQTGESIYLDPVIGQPLTKGFQSVPEPQQWTETWGQDDLHSYSFYGCVKNRGGEFFFAPSVSFLQNLS